jgi:hypothetical protein
MRQNGHHVVRATKPLITTSPSRFPFPMFLVLTASIHSAMFVSSRPVLEQSCHTLMDCHSCLQSSHSCSWCAHNNNCINTTTSNPLGFFNSCQGGLTKECSSSSSTASSRTNSSTMDDIVFSSKATHGFDDLFKTSTTSTTTESGSIGSSSAVTAGGVQTLENSDTGTLDNFFGDVNYAQQQWVFDMIHLGPVWEQGIFGNGVRVRINDDGVDGDNVEFQGRFDISASCDNEEEYLAQSGRQHGTSVASILGAAAGNGACTVGVAPMVRLSSCYALQPNESFLGTKIDQMDISQNSYERPVCQSADASGRRRRRAATQGCPFVKPSKTRENDPCLMCNFASTTILPDGCKNAIVNHCRSHYEDEKDGCTDYLSLIIGGTCSYVGLSDIARESIVRGVNEGRGGLGIIYVFGSGNAYFKGDYTTLKGYTNTRLTISVGAVGKDRKHAYYSTPGASLFVSAPGADREDPEKHYAAQVGGGCIDVGMGTSFSAPVVSGVISLMLEANPTLGWRDVQGILAQSSTPVLDYIEEEDDDSATTNGAGFWHSVLYGFGLVNAASAVDLAKTWTNYGPEQLISVDSGILDYPIVDDPATATTSSLIVSTSDHQANAGQSSDSSHFVVETVELLLNIAHFSRGDLKVELMSPSGTTSLLHPGKLPENMQPDSDEFWKLMTVRNWGESPFGEWKLSIRDEKAGQLSECVDAAGFSFYYGSVEVNCLFLVNSEICLDGRYNEEFFNQGNYEGLKEATDDQGLTMTDACCACGGGLDRSFFVDKLRHWTLAVYGRLAEGPESIRDSPSSSPTTLNANTKLASLAPTIPASPSQPPLSTTSSLPSVAASQYPTTAPTLSPSTISPTSPPTETGSSIPSWLPSVTPSLTPTLIDSSTPSSTPSIPPSSTPSIPLFSAPSIQPSTVTSDPPSTLPSTIRSDSPNQHISDMPTAAVSSMQSMPLSNTTSLPPTVTPTDGKVDLHDPLGSPSTRPSQSPSIILAELPSRDDLAGLDNNQGTASNGDDNNSYTNDEGNDSDSDSTALTDPGDDLDLASGSMSDELTGVTESSPSSPPGLRSSTMQPLPDQSSCTPTTQKHFHATLGVCGCLMMTSLLFGL